MRILLLTKRGAAIVDRPCPGDTLRFPRQRPSTFDPAGGQGSISLLMSPPRTDRVFKRLDPRTYEEVE